MGGLDGGIGQPGPDKLDGLSAQINDEAIRISQKWPRPTLADKDTGRQARQPLEAYYDATLLPRLRDALPNADVGYLGLMGLASYVGPPGTGCLPGVMAAEMMGLAKQHPGTSPAALAIAYGTGWKRAVRCGLSAWDDPWPGAIEQIMELTHRIADENPRPVEKDPATGYRARRSLEDHYSQALLPKVRQALCDIDPPGLEAICLLALLGPRRAGAPPGDMIRALSALGETFPNTPLVELAVAYGAGWSRAPAAGASAWHDLWPGSLQEITDAAYTFVAQTWRILTNMVEGFEWPAGWPKDKTELRDYAAMVAGQFICRAPKVGPKAAQMYHSVKGWDPNRGNLYGWLQLAIQGKRPNKEGWLTTNYFLNGLLFPILKAEGKLTILNVASMKCLCPPILKHCDVRNWARFCSKLDCQRRSKSPSPGKKIWQLLSSNAHETVKSAATSDPLQAGDIDGLLLELNGILLHRDFYDERAFSQVSLPEQAKKLLRFAPSAILTPDVQGLNHLLLKASYPEEIEENDCLKEIGYHWDPCKSCGLEYKPNNRRIFAKTRLAVPLRSVPRRFSRCQAHKREHGYFDPDEPVCPHCQGPRSQRYTHLFVHSRRGGGSASWSKDI